VQTIFGRKLTLGSNSRSAFNYVIQGSSGDLLKIALIRCWKYAKANGGSIRNTIHDEIVFDNLDPDTHIPHLIKLMEDFNLIVPIVANASVSDKSWGDVEPWQPV
jgi:DNA polymerase I-like protein with 3'-5' exonuclease and polymerase domains